MLHQPAPQTPAVLPCLQAGGEREHSPSGQRQSTDPGHTVTVVSHFRLPRQGREGKQFVCREASFVCMKEPCGPRVPVVLSPSGQQAFYQQSKGAIFLSCGASQTISRPLAQRQQVSPVHIAEVPSRGSCLQGLFLLPGGHSHAVARWTLHGMADTAFGLTRAPAHVVTWWPPAAVDDIASHSVPFWAGPSALRSLSLHRGVAVGSLSAGNSQRIASRQSFYDAVCPPSLHLVTLPI